MTAPRPHIEQIYLLYYIAMVLPTPTLMSSANPWISVEVICRYPPLVDYDLDLFLPSLIARDWVEYSTRHEAVRLTDSGRQIIQNLYH